MLKTLTLILSLTVASAVVGNDARQQLDAFADGLDALSGKFEQITIDENGRVVEEASGELFFSRPDLFRWDYHEPFPQQIVADGEKLWHFDESLDQVSVRDQPEAAESPLLVLTRPELLDRFYRIAAANDPEILEFEPLSDEGEFELAQLHFRRGMPAMLELHDRFGQITRVMLGNLIRNPTLDPATFRFTPPPGVDVLEGY